MSVRVFIPPGWDTLRLSDYTGHNEEAVVLTSGREVSFILSLLKVWTGLLVIELSVQPTLVLDSE
jgi:hypothetical protein